METTQKMQNLEFRVFEGPSYEQMPKLIAAGLVPASAAQVMRGQLEGKLSFDKYYDSGDVIVCHPDGRVKLVYDSQDLRKLDAESPLKDGALVLPNGAWESIKGEEFSRDETEKYTGRGQVEDSVKGNPFWQWLARNDQKLLGEYANQVFSALKSRHCYGEAMGVYVSTPEDTVVLRLWCLGGVDYGGDRLGDDGLDGNFGRLVGVVSAGGAAEMKARVSAPRKKPAVRTGKRPQPLRPSLEEVLAFGSKYVPQVVQAEFEKGLRRLYQKRGAL